MRTLSLLFLSFSLMTFAADEPPAQTPLSTYTTEDIALTAEGAPSTFVNHVNTVFGNFLLPTADFVVPGPTPMPMVRYYNSDSTISTWLHGVGMSSNYPLWIRGAYPSETVFHQTIPKISFPLEQEPPRRWPTPEDDLELDDGPEAEDLCEYYIREREKVSPSPLEENFLEKSPSNREERDPEPQKTYIKSSQDDKKYAYAYAEEDGGSVLYFTAKPERKEMVFYLDPQTIHKGLTNVGSGEISARTNLKNMRFHSKVKRGSNCFYIYDPDGYEVEWTVALSNGGERHYNAGKSFHKEKTIREEIKPNGNKLLFTCSPSKTSGASLQKIISTDNSKHRHFGWIEAKYPTKKNKLLVHSSTGQFAAYHYEYHSTKKLKDAPYITKVYSSNHPTTAYEYTSCDGKRLMSKIVFPQGRYLRIKYDDKGRVEEQRGPVGKHNKEAAIYRFKYHPEDHHTTVYDANDNKTLYHYSSKKRLKSIERLDKKGKLLREDRFFWGDREEVFKGERDASTEGNLVARATEGPDGVVASTRYFYDDFGNIVKEKFYGNLTGTSQKFFSVDSDGKPQKKPETYRKFAKYTNDRFHLCTERSEESGPTLTFRYKENSDLLTAKFTQDGSRIIKREFFEYDSCCVLIKKIVDDGSSHDEKNLKNVSERHITHIKPVRDREDYGVGLPEEIRECYLESGKEKLLKKVRFHYTKEGRVSKEIHFDADDRERVSISYCYDYLGNITQKKHSGGKEYLYSYDANGNKTREEFLGSGFYRTFSYDAANRLIQETETHSQGQKFTTSYTYDPAGNKTSMTDRFGQTFFYSYDALGHVTKVRRPAMLDKADQTIFPVETTDYTVLNKPEAITDANGNLTAYEYTARGQPTLISYPDGSTEKFTYNTNGTLAKKIDRHGVETTYEYDVLQRVTKTITGGSKITTHTYSAFHETSSTDPAGNTTTYRYDAAGRLSEKISGGQKTTYGYDALGRKNSIKEFLEDGSFIETIQKFDLFDRLIKEKRLHADGTLLSRKKYAYDILDNRTEVKTYSSRDTSYTEHTSYNSQGLPTAHTDALGHTTRSEYDHAWKNELGQKVFKKTTIDPLSNVTIEISDAFHRIDTIEKRSSKNELLAKTLFRYDARGNKTLQKEFVYAGGALVREYVIAWTYTPSDQIASCTEQPGTLEEKKTAYSYTRGGLIETITKPDGVVVSHSYDEFARLASITSSDNTISYTYSYDLNDNVLSVRDNVHNLTHTKTYDNHNRVLKDTLGTGVEISYVYDTLDRVKSLTTCGHQVDYLYQSGRLKNIACSSEKSSYTHSYEAFDLRGNVTQSSLIASCGTLTQTWDPLNRLEKISSEHFEETSSNFDAAGNLLETILKDPQGSLTSTFSYDDLYQLVEEKGVIDASYKNDSLHNRLSKNDAPYTINSLNQLLADNETAYEYDKNGNPVVVGSMRLTYDALDRLIMLERPGYSRTLYTYDESHRRISKTTSLLKEGDWVEEEHFHFLFFNKREIGSINAQGALSEFRVLGLGKGAELGASIALELGGKTFAPLHDHRGNITLLIDTETKQPSDTYRYSAFGEETTFGSTLNPWRFASKRVDLESGFSFFGRRYYSPSVGRFLTPDPIGFADGPNLYAYVHNSPMVLVDPYGLSAANIEGPSAGDTSTYSWNPGSNGSDNSFWHSSDNTSSFSEGPSGASQCDSGGLLSNLYDFTIGLGWRIFAPEEALFSENDNHKKSNARVLGEHIGTGIGILSYAMPFFLPAKAIVTGVRVSSSAARGSISLMRAEKTISVIAKEGSLAGKASSVGTKVLGVGKESASSVLRGTRNPVVREACRKGIQAHKDLKEKVEAREREGWRPEVMRRGEDGKWYRPDVMKPDETFLELKPNSPSGIAAGQSQASNYEKQLKVTGEVIYYDSTTGEPLYDF